MTDKFDKAIVREALRFTQKIMLLSDPVFQAEHEQGLSEIQAGKGITIDELTRLNK